MALYSNSRQPRRRDARRAAKAIQDVLARAVAVSRAEFPAAQASNHDEQIWGPKPICFVRLDWPDVPRTGPESPAD